VLFWPQHDNEYLYVIRGGQKVGFINRSGAVVVAPKYDGVAGAAYINTEGAVVWKAGKP
jgi:hypothetical protein